MTPQAADQLFFEADATIKQGRYPEAIHTLEQAIEKNPQHGRAYNHLGWIHETKYQNFNKAEECYKKALEYAPEYPAVYINYSVLLTTLGKWDELEQLLGKAVKVPGHDQAIINSTFGTLKERTGHYDEAIEYFKKAIGHALTAQEVQNYKDAIERCKAKKPM